MGYRKMKPQSLLSPVIMMATAALVVFLGLRFAVDESPIPSSLNESRLPPEKQAIIDAEAARRSEAASLPTAPYRGPPTPAPYTPVPPSGTAAGDGVLIPSGQAPFSSMAYLFENSWRASVGSETVIVYAGAATQDRNQGVVLVAVQDSNGNFIPAQTGRYETPGKVGSVRIVDAEGTTVVLQAADGTTYRFDPLARVFV